MSTRLLECIRDYDHPAITRTIENMCVLLPDNLAFRLRNHRYNRPVFFHLTGLTYDKVYRDDKDIAARFNRWNFTHLYMIKTCKDPKKFIMSRLLPPGVVKQLETVFPETKLCDITTDQVVALANETGFQSNDEYQFNPEWSVLLEDLINDEFPIKQKINLNRSVDESISVLGLKNSTFNILSRSNIRTIGQLLDLFSNNTKREIISKIKSFGQGRYNETLTKLTAYVNDMM